MGLVGMTWLMRAPLRRGYKTLIVDVNSKGVCVITLNRPKKKNAFNVAMYEELGEALEKASSSNEIKVAVVTGAGDFYSSGNDLSNFSQLMHPLTMAAQSRLLLRDFVNHFLTLRKPLICAVNGPAIGIAVTALGLADYVIASKTATFKTPFAELAQSPEGCSSFTFPRLMGEEAANNILWRGATLTANQACQANLVHEVVEDTSRLLPRALEYAESLASLPPNDPKLVKNVTKMGVEQLQKVNEEECAVLEKKWISKECFEALSSYLSSRKMHTAAFVLRYYSIYRSIN